MDTSIFSAFLEQIVHNPGSLLIIFVISICGFLLEMWPQFPNRVVWLMCSILGMVLYPLVTSVKTVAPSYPYPVIILVLTGVVCGFIAAAVHVTLIRWLISKLPTKPPETKPPENN